MKLKPNSILRRAIHCAILSLAVFAFTGAGDPATRFDELGHQTDVHLQLRPDSSGMQPRRLPRLRRHAQRTHGRHDRGDSDSLVEQSFVQKYGPTVLAAPTATGFDRTAWIMPFVALFAGFGIVVIVIRAWKNRPTPALADGIRPVRGAELEQFRDQARKETDL